MSSVEQMPIPDDAAEFARLMAGMRSHWLRDYRAALYSDLEAGLNADQQDTITFCAERISAIGRELRRRGDE